MASSGSNSVLAVIPTFCPPPDLADLVQALTPQVDSLLLTDDASPCTYDPLLESVHALSGVSILRHRHNRGIARGLNDGLRAANAANVTWLLTVDQDSRLGTEYVANLLETIISLSSGDKPIAAMGAEVVDDASGEMRYPSRHTDSGTFTEELIQTGTLWNVAAMNRVDGFDERLAIDAVDAAACLALREHEYEIAVAPGARIQHAIGNATQIRLFGRPIMVTNHSPERRASMLRNRLRLFPRELRQDPRHALRTLRRVGLNQSLGLAMRLGKSSDTI